MLADVRAFAAPRGADIVLTEYPRHAFELATRAIRDGCELVVAVGGDGTMNEIASALTGSPTILGLIPCGSGDGLALHLGLSRRAPQALQLLVTGRPRLIDTGEVNGRPFFNAMGLGFEAEIARRFAGFRRRGLPGYFRAGVPLFFSHRAETLTVEHDGGRATIAAFSLAVQNSSQLGNNAVTAPDASVDDGLFDVVALPPVGLIGALGLMTRLGLRTFGRAPGVTRLRSARLVIERPAPGAIHTDGEPHEAAARLEITLRPRSLRVLAPPPIKDR